MNAWGGGYVTDVGYTIGYYGEQSPLHLALACLLQGVACDMPGPDDPVHVLELGCGQGFTALVLAASNPAWRVTGIDFHPGQVALARALAREAGLANVTFLEADLATLAGEPLLREVPQADFVTMHGLWSWVPPPVRAGVVRLLAARVRPGGVVHVSYNALPGWQTGLGLQRTLRLAGAARAGRSDRQVVAGLGLLREMLDAEAVHLAPLPFARGMVEHAGQQSPAYLAHEYMNEAWSPCFHADVATALAEAKLDWVGSADLPENFPELKLTEAQRAVVDKVEPPLLRELVQDMFLQRSFRRDVYVRGARGLDPATRHEALGGVTLALATPPARFPYEIKVPSGMATLSEAFYGPILRTLAEGPRRVADLLALPELAGRNGNPGELAAMLAGRGHALPVLRPGERVGEAAARFNRVALRRLVRPQAAAESLALAGAGLGAGFPATSFELYVADRLSAGGDPDLEGWIAESAPSMAPAQLAELRALVARTLAERVPLMRAAGVV